MRTTFFLLTFVKTKLVITIKIKIVKRTKFELNNKKEIVDRIMGIDCEESFD